MDALEFELDFERVEALLPRYLASVPRYTSYPTAPVWSEAYGPRDLRRDLAQLGGEEAALSLYVHVPFCRSLCHFCACHRIVTRDPALPARYLDAIEAEIETVRRLAPDAAGVTQLHWGGGTPTHLSPDQVRRLFRSVVTRFPLRPDAELSIEVDPRVTTPEHVAALRECGFDRISLGVQDFDPRVQQAVRRIQPRAQVAELVAQAREAGFRSVGLDLIYGLPLQSVMSFERTLADVLVLVPDRVALYAYAHVTWVAKQQRGFERRHLPDPAMRMRILLGAIRRFVDAGYVYVGMDHFARPGDALARAYRDGTLRRNFMGYTTQAGVDLVGFGPSAISELRASYAQSQRDLAAWERAVRARDLPTLRGHRLSGDDRARRWIIGSIMCRGGVDAAAYGRAFGRELRRDFAAELERLGPLERDGLLGREADGSLRLTALGRLLVRHVAAAFDAYLPAQLESARPLFSRAI